MPKPALIAKRPPTYASHHASLVALTELSQITEASSCCAPSPGPGNNAIHANCRARKKAACWSCCSNAVWCRGSCRLLLILLPLPVVSPRLRVEERRRRPRSRASFTDQMVDQGAILADQPAPNRFAEGVTTSIPARTPASCCGTGSQGLANNRLLRRLCRGVGAGRDRRFPYEKQLKNPGIIAAGAPGF